MDIKLARSNIQLSCSHVKDLALQVTVAVTKLLAIKCFIVYRLEFYTTQAKRS